MKKQIQNKISQIFYRSPKKVGEERISTSLGTFEKEIGNAMDTFFRTEKKAKAKGKDKDKNKGKNKDKVKETEED